jgi:hypothetical protein
MSEMRILARVSVNETRPGEKVEMSGFSRKRNKANENLRTANNPRQSDFSNKNVRLFALFVSILHSKVLVCLKTYRL